MSVRLEPFEAAEGSTLESGRVLALTLDRPPLNILDLATLERLGQAVQKASARCAAEPALSLLVVRGAAPKAFSAGVAVEDHTPEKVPEMLRLFHDAARRLRTFPVPTLAAVQGHCLGGGLELAASCDLTLADAGASFGVPEVHLGCFPPLAAAWWPERLGRARTLELVLSGRTFGSEEARELGLVTWVAPTGDFEAQLAATAERLTTGSAPVIRLIQRAVSRPGQAAGLTASAALDSAERLYTQELLDLADMEEGLAAFQEKRPPRWRHR